MSTPGAGTGAPTKNLVLAAMVFAVAMTFIDQTIVAIAIPKIQSELSLSASVAVRWLPRGRLEHVEDEAAPVAPAVPDPVR